MLFLLLKRSGAEDFLFFVLYRSSQTIIILGERFLFPVRGVINMGRSGSFSVNKIVAFDLFEYPPEKKLITTSPTPRYPPPGTTLYAVLLITISLTHSTISNQWIRQLHIPVITLIILNEYSNLCSRYSPCSLLFAHLMVH